MLVGKLWIKWGIREICKVKLWSNTLMRLNNVMVFKLTISMPIGRSADMAITIAHLMLLLQIAYILIVLNAIVNTTKCDYISIWIHLSAIAIPCNVENILMIQINTAQLGKFKCEITVLCKVSILHTTKNNYIQWKLYLMF